MSCEFLGMCAPNTHEMEEFDMIGTTLKISSEQIHRMATEGGGR